MTKTLRTYLVILVLIFLGAIAIEFSKPKPINWSKTFNETHKIPYGTYIYFNELNQLFPNSEIKEIGVTPFEFFNQYYNYEDLNYFTGGTYMYIDEMMSIDEV